MMLRRDSSGVPSANPSDSSMLLMSFAASVMFTSGSESLRWSILKWRAVTGIICISPQAPLGDTTLCRKRDSL